MILNQSKLNFEEVDFSFHALKRMRCRGITFEQAQAAIESPDKVSPSISREKSFHFKKDCINVAVAFDSHWPVVTSVWKFTVERVRSERRREKNEFRRQHNVANKIKRLGKHGRKVNSKGPRDHIAK